MSDEKEVQEAKSKEPKKSEHATELEKLALEAARLEVEYKTVQLQNARQTIDDHKMKLETKRANFVSHGQNLAQDRLKRDASQRTCNHRKGGDGARGVVAGQGQDTQYAILRHRMANGDIWVRCLRCAKTWKPPVKSEHKSTESYNAAFVLYKEALDFPTRSIMSTGQQFQWGYNDKGKGGPEFYREKMASVNLE